MSEPENKPRTRRLSVTPRVVLDDVDEWLAEESRWWPVAVLEGPDLPFDLHIRVARQPDGRLAITGMKLNGYDRATEITAKSLRVISFSDVLKAASDAIFAEDPAFSSALLGYDVGNVAPRSRPRLRPGPPGYDRSFFAEVADAYREAELRDPTHPYDHFMKHWGGGLSLSTARRWVQRARDKGLLGPANMGKAGERQAEEASDDDS